MLTCTSPAGAVYTSAYTLADVFFPGITPDRHAAPASSDLFQLCYQRGTQCSWGVLKLALADLDLFSVYTGQYAVAECSPSQIAARVRALQRSTDLPVNRQGRRSPIGAGNHRSRLFSTLRKTKLQQPSSLWQQL